MWYVVNTDEGTIIARYGSERGAKIANTRKKMGGEVMRSDVYDVAYRRKVPVKNLMNGKTVMLDVNDVGGPCDPSTERYWSM